MLKHTCTSLLPKRQIESLKQKNNNVKNYGEWLNSIEWNYYCTFTSRYQLSIFSAQKAMERLFDNLVTNYGICQMFWVAEPFDTKYGYHTHALIKFSELQSKSMIPLVKKSWQIVSKGRGQKEYNNTIIKPYDKTLGGHFYVAKYLGRYNAEYGFL